MRRLLGGLLLIGAMPRGVEAECYRDADCGLWEVCTVSLGDCRDAGDSSADVCTGACVAGHAWQVIGRAGLLVRDGGVEADLGVELEPPVLGGYLALAADYVTSDLWRLGLAVRAPVLAALRAGVRADWIAGAASTTGAAAARLEWAPERTFEALALLRWFTVSIEAGLLFGDGARAGFGTLGVGVWPPPLARRR